MQAHNKTHNTEWENVLKSGGINSISPDLS